MGGFAGGIIAGAMGGFGGAMERQGDIAQQQQGQLNNMATLSQLNAQLDLQKQASLMRMQQDNKIAMLNRLDQPSPQDQSAQQPASGATVTSAPAGQNPTASDQPVPQMGLDTSQMSPATIAYLKAQDPDAFAQGVANMGVIKAHQQAAAGVPGDAGIPVDGGISHAVLDTTATHGVNYPVPQATSGGVGQPAIWQPSKELQIAALKSDLYNPGSGLEILKAAVPDATGKMLLAKGIQPGTQAWHDGYTAALNKANGEVMRGGNTLMIGGKPVFAAVDGDGNQIIYDDNGTAHIVRSAGANATAMQQAAAEKGGALMGTNPLTPASTDLQRRDPKTGEIIPTTVQQLVDSSASPNPIRVGLAPGAAKGADNAQDILKDKFAALSALNSNSQSTIANLQMIKHYSSQAAVGGASKLDYLNHILAAAGFSTATDTATANDMLNKNSNQIVAKLGSISGSTDAARSIVESANPNSHMTPEAINEAADNLIGAQQLIQAKTRLLQPYATNKNPDGYLSTETKFDTAADPRIYQFKNMTPEQQSQFITKNNNPSVIKMMKEGRGSLIDLGAY